MVERGVPPRSIWEPRGRSMTKLSEQELLVLNGVHLKKMATAEEIAGAVGLDDATVATVLADAAGNELLIVSDGRHLLLPEGTNAVQDHYRAAYDSMRSNALVLSWYDRFETVNEQFIKQV